MKAKELIELLKQQDPEAVVMFNEGLYGLMDIDSIRSSLLSKNDNGSVYSSPYYESENGDIKAVIL